MTFDCPRCGEPADERFYGPCRICRAWLQGEYSTVYAPARRAEIIEESKGDPGRD